MRKLLKNKRDFIIAAAVGAGLMVLYLFTRDLFGIEPPDWILAILSFSAALIISVTIHEIGHLMAGKAVGFRFFMLTVGPFKIQRKGNRLHAGINKHLNTGGGLTIMLPKTARYIDSDLFWFILGGPLGNFAFTLVSMAAILIVVIHTPEFAGSLTVYMLYTAAFVNLLIGAAALIPTQSDTFESDGTQLLDLKKGGDKAAIKQRLMALSVSIWNGTRPRDIDKEELNSLLEMTTVKKDTSALTARVINGLFYLDSGLINEAEAEFDTIIEHLEQDGNVILEGTVYSEKAFISAAYRRDAKMAQTFLDKAQKGYTEDQTIARAEAALMILNEKFEEAKERAKEGIKSADESIDRGSAIFEKEILSILSGGKLLE